MDTSASNRKFITVTDFTSGKLAESSDFEEAKGKAEAYQVANSVPVTIMEAVVENGFMSGTKGGEWHKQDRLSAWTEVTPLHNYDVSDPALSDYSDTY